MPSLLDSLRSQNKDQATDLDAYNRALQECPPISAALLAYLDKLFARRLIKPTEPTMQQELVYQAGIDKVLTHLRSQNARQEREIKELRTK